MLLFFGYYWIFRLEFSNSWTVFLSFFHEMKCSFFENYTERYFTDVANFTYFDKNWS